MTLYIIGGLLITTGIFMAGGNKNTAYKDMWADLLIVLGVLFIVSEILITIWR